MHEFLPFMQNMNQQLELGGANVVDISFQDDYGYKCQVCQRLFLQRCDRERHMLIHTGQEPHRCQQCNKGTFIHNWEFRVN